jgi:hypothetical protein
MLASTLMKSLMTINLTSRLLTKHRIKFRELNIQKLQKVKLHWQFLQHLNVEQYIECIYYTRILQHTIHQLWKKVLL